MVGPELPDGATEDDTERDGVLSYAKEWHALIIGLGAGLAAATTGRWDFLAIVTGLALGLGGASKASATVAVNVKKEPWYALAGLAIGTAAGVLLQAVWY